jgi:hypothetical protein
MNYLKILFADHVVVPTVVAAISCEPQIRAHRQSAKQKLHRIECLAKDSWKSQATTGN